MLRYASYGFIYIIVIGYMLYVICYMLYMNSYIIVIIIIVRLAFHFLTCFCLVIHSGIEVSE